MYIFKAASSVICLCLLMIKLVPKHLQRENHLYELCIEPFAVWHHVDLLTSLWLTNQPQGSKEVNMVLDVHRNHKAY